MDEDRKPRSRERKVVSGGRGVHRRGEGLGTGPVGNTGNYADRRGQESGPQQTGSRPAASFPGASSPRQQQPSSQSRPSQPAGSPFSGSQRPGASGPFGAPFTTPQSRPSQGSSPVRPPQSGSAKRMNTRPSGAVPPGARASGSGCSSKLFLVVIALVVLLGGGKLSGLLGGNDSPVPEALPSPSGSQSASGGLGGLFGDLTDSGSQSTSGGLGGLIGDQAGSGSGSSGLTDLLSAFLGSSSSSVYDFPDDPMSLLTGGSASAQQSASSGVSASQAGSSASSGSSSSAASAPAGSGLQPDTSVSSKARAKYTAIRGKGRDTVTVMVYLCGTDLESQNGMGTSDLKEMASASFGKNVSLIVYTGGCRRWRNNVVSSSVNQIYQIQDGKLYCLEKNMGSGAMTSPATLTSFIRYGAEHFPADRMCLILWDHGGGSVTGYGYDEKTSSRTSMSLAGIETALRDGGQKFDFIGFDACLMATVENGLMLSRYADYMIASEETEPGVGWYYTNWLTKLGRNTSMPTVEIGKAIADDFVEVCARQCRGQGTTLSVVDLAELQATVPARLSAFGKGTNELIQQKEYKTVATARSKTREFAQSTRIDQVDLVHFARNLGTKEGSDLAKALQGAVKYNRTGGGMSSAYGLSVYFPYKRTGKVSQMVSTYQQIGMDEEYTRCIQEFASLELSGQFAAGTSPVGYSSQGIGSSSLLSSLLGTGSYSGGISSSPSDMTGLLDGLFGGSYGGGYGGGQEDIFGLFSGRSLTSGQVAEYLSAHHLDASALFWQGNRISLSGEQWGEVDSLVRNVFVDDGQGYIDLGTSAEFTLDGDDLVDDFDGTWLSIDGQPVAYYYLGTEDDGEHYAISGYAPAFLNGVRVNLMILFDDEHPYGIISGASPVYAGGETEAVAKNLIRIGAGDELQFICEYYDYQGNYQDTFLLGEPVVLGKETEIANTPIGDAPMRVTYCFTDYYQQRYWTPARLYGT